MKNLYAGGVRVTVFIPFQDVEANTPEEAESIMEDDAKCILEDECVGAKVEEVVQTDAILQEGLDQPDGFFA
jgi:nicotinate-nucleotide pyrophosphorylase